MKELAAPFKNSGINITMDNYFTTLPIAKHLLSWKLTITGTLRKNKPYIPKQMAAALCSYVPKKKQSCNFTFHHALRYCCKRR